MPNTLPFDVRTLVTYTEEDILSRAEFDQAHFTLNRTLFLLDDLPFRDLFTLPLSDVLLHLQSRAAKTDTFRLLEEPASIANLQQELQRIHEAWRELDEITQQETIRHPVSVVVQLLRAQKILLPDFHENKQVKEAALERLLASSAAICTYRDVFVGTRTDMEQLSGALEAVQQARMTEVLPAAGNGRCCFNHKCQLGEVTDFCIKGSDGKCTPGAIDCMYE